MYRGSTMMIIFLFLSLGSSRGELFEVASWRLLTFAPPAGFPGASPAGLPIYAPMTTFTGLEATNDRLFLSMPRTMPGQPISLGWVPRPRPGTRLPLDLSINPFPDWEWHRSAANGMALNNCSALISVFRSRIDHCGRLWVLDTGTPHTPIPNSRACLPKILVFNTATGQLIRRIDFRDDLLRPNSVLVNLVLDTRNQPGVACDNMFVYIADSTAPAVIVYNVQTDRGWRLTGPQMYPSPDHGIFKVAGETFSLMDGITGMALSNVFQSTVYRPETGYTDRNLYFQTLSSDRIFSVAASELLSGPKADGTLSVTLVGYKPSQGVPLAVDRQNATIIFSSVSESWVISWDPTKNQSGLLAYNTNLLQFVMDLVVDQQEVWAISSRFQQFFNRKVNPSDVNLRILRIDRT